METCRTIILAWLLVPSGAIYMYIPSDLAGRLGVGFRHLTALFDSSEPAANKIILQNIVLRHTDVFYFHIRVHVFCDT